MKNILSQEQIQRNRHSAVITCNRVIRGLIKQFPVIKDKWRQNKDGHLHKSVEKVWNEVINQVSQFETERTNEKHNSLCGPAPVRVFPVHRYPDRKVICYQVRVSYKDSQYSNSYIENHVYLGPDSWGGVRQGMTKTFPLTSWETVQEQKNKIAEINKKVDALREKQRDISRNFGYEYFK